MEDDPFSDEDESFLRALFTVIEASIKSKGLQLKEVSLQAKRSESFLSSVLKGEVKITLDDVVLIANTLGVTPRSLISEARKLKVVPEPQEEPVIEEVADARNPIQRAYERANNPMRTLGLRFVTNQSLLVDPEDPIALQNRRAARERRKARVEQMKVLTRPRR